MYPSKMMGHEGYGASDSYNMQQRNMYGRANVERDMRMGGSRGVAPGAYDQQRYMDPRNMNGPTQHHRTHGNGQMMGRANMMRPSSMMRGHSGGVPMGGGMDVSGRSGAPDISGMRPGFSNMRGRPSHPGEMGAPVGHHFGARTMMSRDPQISFNDMQEFPSLVGTRNIHSGMPIDPMTGHATDIGAHYADQIMQRRSEFTLQNENFPALPGAPRSSASGERKAGAGIMRGKGSEKRDNGVPASNGGVIGATRKRDMGPPKEVGRRAPGEKTVSGGSTSLGPDTKASRGTAAPVPGATRPSGATGSQTKYGLLGLLNVIRMTDPDLNTLALGSDLTSLGLNLNSPDCLHSTFASPWSDRPTKCRPSFTLPPCYYMKPLDINLGHIKKFQLETLFYIFYGMPRDALQAHAADELYQRNWRFHKESKLWFIQNRGNSGEYVYFDFNTWGQQMFKGDVAALRGGFVDAKEIQLKHVKEGGR